MAWITLLSAKGSPGVTTLTMGLALEWAPTTARTVLAVDADPIGGDVAAGILGGALPERAGMLALATSRGTPATEAVESAAVDLCGTGAVRLLPGVPDSSRAGALVLAWDVLASIRGGLDDSGCDVLVDAGRVDLSRPPAPWLTDVDAALLVVRPTLPAVTAAHRFVASWRQPGAPTSGTPLSLVVVDVAAPYHPSEVAAAVGAPARAVVPFDPRAARVHSEGVSAGRTYRRSAYRRAVAGLAGSLATGAAGSHPARDAATSGGRP